MDRERNNMETSEISIHLFKVFTFVSKAKRWHTSKEISAQSKVGLRTTRAHCFRLVKAGILDQAEAFPGHRYRISDNATKRNKGFMQRLEQAKEFFEPLE